MVAKQSYKQFLFLFLLIFSAFISKAQQPNLSILSKDNGVLTATINSSKEYTIHIIPLFQKIPKTIILKVKGTFTVEDLAQGEYAIVMTTSEGDVNTLTLFIN